MTTSEWIGMPPGCVICFTRPSCAAPLLLHRLFEYRHGDPPKPADAGLIAEAIRRFPMASALMN